MKHKNFLKLNYALIISSALVLFSCEPTDSPKPEELGTPEVSITNVSSITETAAICKAEVITDNNNTITQQGICYSTQPEPTITSGSLLTTTNGVGTYEITITNLTKNTTYYVKAFATNSKGTTYSNVLTFTTLNSPIDDNIVQGTITDQEGTEYKTVTLGTQTWMAENLQTATLNDGTSISEITDNTEWTNATSAAYSYYDNNSENNAEYGKLYNWYTVNTQKLCPQGWHVPTKEEWETLQAFLVSEGYALDNVEQIGKALASHTNWDYNTTENTVGYDKETNNRTGFSGIPAGARTFNGQYLSDGKYTFYWTSSERSTPSAYYTGLYYYEPTLENGYELKYYGHSVRCVKD